MPTLTFLERPTGSQLAQIIGLYRQAGWWSATAPDDPALVTRIVTGSHCFVIAVHDNEIIGMGRAISDGASDAYIQDVTVKEPFREQGVGSKIISMLVNRLRDNHIEWVGVIAEQGSYPFYQHLGFKKMKNAFPLFMITNAI